MPRGWGRLGCGRGDAGLVDVPFYFVFLFSLSFLDKLGLYFGLLGSWEKASPLGKGSWAKDGEEFVIFYHKYGVYTGRDFRGLRNIGRFGCWLICCDVVVAEGFGLDYWLNRRISLISELRLGVSLASYVVCKSGAGAM